MDTLKTSFVILILLILPLGGCYTGLQTARILSPGEHEWTVGLRLQPRSFLGGGTLYPSLRYRRGIGKKVDMGIEIGGDSNFCYPGIGLSGKYALSDWKRNDLAVGTQLGYVAGLGSHVDGVLIMSRPLGKGNLYGNLGLEIGTLNRWWVTPQVGIGYEGGGRRTGITYYRNSIILSGAVYWGRKKRVLDD